MNISVNMYGIKHTLKGKSYSKPEMYNRNEAQIMSIRQLKYFLETLKYLLLARKLSVEQENAKFKACELA